MIHQLEGLAEIVFLTSLSMKVIGEMILFIG